MAALLWIHAKPRVGREEGHGAVAPEVVQLGAVRKAAQDVRFIELEDRQELDGSDASVLQVGDLLDGAQEGSLMLRSRVRMLGESPEVHLVEHGVLHGAKQRNVVSPVEAAR